MGLTKGRTAVAETVVQARAPDRADDSFQLRILPRGSGGNPDVLDAHGGNSGPERGAVNTVSVPDQVPRLRVAGMSGGIAGRGGGREIAISPTGENLAGADGLRRHDDEDGQATGPQAIEPECPVERRERGSRLSLSPQHRHLMAKGQDLELKLGAGRKPRSHDTEPKS